MPVAKYTDGELEELMQLAGEMIDPLWSDLQQWAVESGFAPDLPSEVLLLAAGRVVLGDFGNWLPMREEVTAILAVLHSGESA